MPGKREGRVARVKIGETEVDMHVHAAGEYVSDDIVARKIVHCPGTLVNYLLSPGAKARGSYFLDIGGHVGSCTVAAATVGFSVVVAEPNPANAAALYETIKSNSWESKVSLVPCGFGDAPSSGVLYAAIGNSGHSAIGYHKNTVTYEDGQDVHVVRGDDWLRGHNLHGASFVAMKLDTEGFEARAMRGLAELFRDPVRRPALLVVEINNVYLRAQGTSASSLLYFFHDAGYECFRETDGVPVNPPSWAPIGVDSTVSTEAVDVVCKDPGQQG